MKNSKKPICQFVKKDGNRCNAKAISESSYCFWHDPSRAAERAAAQRAGGLNGRAAVLTVEVLPPIPKSIDDMADLLASIMRHVLLGALDPKVANSFGYLVNIWAKLKEQGLLEERLTALEQIVKTPYHPTQPIYEKDRQGPFPGSIRFAEKE